MLKYFKISIILIFLLGCKQAVNNRVDKVTFAPKNAEHTAELTPDTKKELASCQLSEATKIIASHAEDTPQDVTFGIEQKSTTQEIVIKSDELDFTLGEIPEVSIYCYDNQFQIQYLEQMGNNYYTTRHIFEPDNTSTNFVWTKVYKTESTRQGFSVSAAYIIDKTNFNEYKGIEGELDLQPIYEFTGFQEEKEPSISSFYEQIKANSDIKKTQQLALIGNQYVLDCLLENIAIENSNLSKYNDIAYYLEQSKLYNESVFLLEKTIKTFPERTVAYINLGDAYKGLGNTEKAKKAYEKYVELMKIDNNEAKIPQEVWDNIK